MLLTLALSALIGGLLGLLGGGATLLAVPMLVYVAELSVRDAIATSLVVVGTTSFVAMLSHAHRGRVAWRVGGLFAIFSMLGAYGGSQLAHFLPTRALSVGFIGMLLTTSLSLLRPTREPPRPAQSRARPAKVRAAAIGVAIGIFTGTVGAGGGFVIVPALAWLGGLPLRTAIGTSLLVITLNSWVGLAGALGHASIRWSLAASIALAAVIGSLFGAAFSARFQPERLRKTFAWLVLAVALPMAVEQVTQGAFGAP